tara:strand:+ start:248 stop:352 length:105 start_codon:yes stop_codon:yes gene_type:complete
MANIKKGLKRIERVLLVFGMVGVLGVKMDGNKTY